MGLAFGAIGMGIWIPFFFWPAAFPYPGQAHATVQIQGFLLCFIFGFLGTMMPKVLGVKPLGHWQFAVFPIGLTAIVVFALLGMPRVSQAAHLLVLLNFVVFIFRRWKHRAGTPPPPFVFIGLALAADIVGTCLRIHGLSGHLGSYALRAAGLFQYQAFPLLLILGVGSFLLPKLFASAVVNPQSLAGVKGRIQPVLLVMGLVFLAGFAIEAWGPAVLEGTLAVRIGHAVRAGVWGWFLLANIRIQSVTYPQPAYLEGARMSLYTILAGMILPIIWPAWLLAWEHILFLGGLMWITLSVASRVVTAHSGSMDLLARNRKATVAYGALIVAALIMRVSTDLWTTSRWLHLAVAGALGIAALVLWAWKYFPLFFRIPGRH